MALLVGVPLSIGIAVGLLVARGVWLLAGLVPLAAGIFCAYRAERTGDLGERLALMPAAMCLAIAGIGYLAGGGFRLALREARRVALSPAASGPTVPAPPSPRPPR